MLWTLRRIGTLGLLFGLLLHLCPPASADPPRAPWHQAERGWHVDWDAAMEASWVRDAVAEIWANPLVQKKLEKVPAPLLTLTQTQLRSVTCLQDQGIVVAIRADGDLSPLEEVIEQLPGTLQRQVAGRTLHVTKVEAWRDLLADWIPEKKPAAKSKAKKNAEQEPRLASQRSIDKVVFYIGEGRVVVGDQAEAVAEVADAVEQPAADSHWPRGAVACLQSRRPVAELSEVRQLIVRADRQLHIDCQLEFASTSAAQAVHGMLTPDGVLALVPLPGEPQPPVEDLTSHPASSTDDLFTFAARFHGFHLPEDRARAESFLRTALRTDCAGRELRVRWTSLARLGYELKRAGAATHHAFTAQLSGAPQVALKP